MRCICGTSVFLAGNSARNGVGTVVELKNLFTLQTFKYFKHKDFDRSSQFLVNCFEKIVMQTNNIGFNSIYMFACKWRATGKRQNRKGIQQEWTGEGDSCGTFMRHLRLVWPCLLIAEASRVLCQLVKFLTVFLHWIYLKWNTAAIKSLCYSWLACLLGCGWEMHRSTKRNRKSSFSELTSPCWSVPKVLITWWVSELHLDR